MAPCTLPDSGAQLCPGVCVCLGRNSCKGVLLPVAGNGGVFLHSKGGHVAKSTNPSRLYVFRGCHGEGTVRVPGRRVLWSGMGGVQVAMVTAPLL